MGCDLGYIGGGSTTCLPSGEFSAVVPCRKWRCTDPDVLNGDFDNSDWIDLNENDEIDVTKISCDMHYHRSETNMFSCDCTGEAVRHEVRENRPLFLSLSRTHTHIPFPNVGA